MSIARFVIVLTAAYAVYAVVTGRRQSQRDFDRARTTLLDAASTQAASLSDDEKHAVRRAEAWLVRLAGAYEGDVVGEELRAEGAFAALLAKPLVYVRAPSDALAGPPQIAQAAASSVKDPLVLCLVEPPAARTEAALLDKVRVAYAGGHNMESRTPNVKRLHDAIVGLPFLLPQWSESVRTTTEPADLARRRQEFDRAPIERAKQAATAKLFLVAIDEVGDGHGPTELDGERPHSVRLALVDVGEGKVLLRVRRAVDPSWVSQARRPTYAGGLDGCALGFDVREDVKKAAEKVNGRR